jgi:predicted CoA-substrate-specific enzyme activase
MIVGAGVDVGSTQTKAVLVDAERRVLGRALIDTGANVVRAAERGFLAACAAAGLPREAVACVVGTGYGRYKVSFGDAQITEITCHARGAHALFPGTRTVIDMGGQDTKAIRIGPDGAVIDFAMNDKCAAGTGRFLSAAAEVTGVDLDALGPRALLARAPVRLTSVCTVFVESDIMSYLAQRKTIEDILGGVHRAIATRTMALVRRVGVEEQISFTGGVSRNVAMVAALGEALGHPLNVSPDGHFMGALGAALFALERAAAARRGETAAAPAPAAAGRRAPC